MICYFKERYWLWKLVVVWAPTYLSVPVEVGLVAGDDEGDVLAQHPPQLSHPALHLHNPAY